MVSWTVRKAADRPRLDPVACLRERHLERSRETHDAAELRFGGLVFARVVQDKRRRIWRVPH